MMWNHMSGYGWGWTLFGGLHFIAFWLLIILAIAALLKWLSSGPFERPSASSKSALDILKERYARGEISREDYERIRADLEK
jgi:putative membrane protein